MKEKEYSELFNDLKNLAKIINCIAESDDLLIKHKEMFVNDWNEYYKILKELQKNPFFVIDGRTELSKKAKDGYAEIILRYRSEMYLTF